MPLLGLGLEVGIDLRRPPPLPRRSWGWLTWLPLEFQLTWHGCLPLASMRSWTWRQAAAQTKDALVVVDPKC